ncbi:hypothetical protein CJEDD_10450 [Corynebacterium jeddahense]|uniref:Secreted protein n=1 Tax=Corynebacterium jeddahense TaxID=1414719 RepID=A0ABY7UPE3_9CORY|nr:hypothetical protein CJEDD_10450 [Corynebacterium jeddahense]
MRVLAVGAIAGAFMQLVALLVTPGVEEAAPVGVEKPAPAPAPDGQIIVPDGRPVEMYIPAIGLVAGFEQGELQAC